MMVTQDDASPSASGGSACTAARSSTSTTRSATTAASTRCRRRCCPPSCRTSPDGARSAARTRRTTTRRFADLADSAHAVHRSGERVDLQSVHDSRPSERDALQAHLKGGAIGTSIYYPLPLHLQPCFAYLGYKPGAFPESERASSEVLSLPVFPSSRQSQLDEVIEAVRSFFGKLMRRAAALAFALVSRPRPASVLAQHALVGLPLTDRRTRSSMV